MGPRLNLVGWQRCMDRRNQRDLLECDEACETCGCKERLNVAQRHHLPGESQLFSQKYLCPCSFSCIGKIFPIHFSTSCLKSHVVEISWL